MMSYIKEKKIFPKCSLNHSNLWLTVYLGFPFNLWRSCFLLSYYSLLPSAGDSKNRISVTQIFLTRLHTLLWTHFLRPPTPTPLPCKVLLIFKTSSPPPESLPQRMSWRSGTLPEGSHHILSYNPHHSTHLFRLLLPESFSHVSSLRQGLCSFYFVFSESDIVPPI